MVAPVNVVSAVSPPSVSGRAPSGVGPQAAAASVPSFAQVLSGARDARDPRSDGGESLPPGAAGGKNSARLQARQGAVEASPQPTQAAQTASAASGRRTSEEGAAAADRPHSRPDSETDTDSEADAEAAQGAPVAAALPPGMAGVGDLAATDAAMAQAKTSAESAAGAASTGTPGSDTPAAKPGSAPGRPGQLRDEVFVPRLDGSTPDASQTASNRVQGAAPSDIEALMRAVQQRLAGAGSTAPVASGDAAGSAVTRVDHHANQASLQAGPVLTDAGAQSSAADSAAQGTGDGSQSRQTGSNILAQIGQAPVSQGDGQRTDASSAGSPSDGTAAAGLGAQARNSVPVPVGQDGGRPPATPAFTMPQGLSPGSGAWGQAMGDRILIMSSRGLHGAEIRLDPPELGSLHVRLHLHQDQISLSFTSPHAAVRDALEQQMPRLRDLFAEQGLNLGDSSVADDPGRQESSPERPQGGSGGPLFVDGDNEVATVPERVMRVRSLVDHYV